MELVEVKGTCSLRILSGNDSQVTKSDGLFRNRHAFAAWLRSQKNGYGSGVKAIQLQTTTKRYRNLRRYRRCGFRTITKYKGQFHITQRVRIMILKMPNGAVAWVNKYS